MSTPNLFKQIEHALKSLEKLKAQKKELEKLKDDGDSFSSNIQPECDK